MPDNSRVRVSIVGVVIVALFCSLVARLWFLQMGPEQSLKAKAAALATRTIQTPSQRGRILDAHGVVLAQDVASWAVTLDRNMKRSTRDRVLGQLSELLGKPEKDLLSAYNDLRQSPLKPAILASGIDNDTRLSILVHQDQYPGVGIEQLWQRQYPAAVKYNFDTFAAQVLGYVGEINGDELKKMKRSGYQPGDLIGQSGVEKAYESVLRGVPEIDRIPVDPTGRQIGPAIVVQQGRPGDDVYLAMDADVQNAAEVSLRDGLAYARTLPSDPNHPNTSPRNAAPGGAVVVLNARDGSVVAMASNPAVPPSKWVGGMKQSDLDGYLHDPTNPLLNRATAGQYAPGSTFKLVTSLAETRFNLRTVYTPFDDSGCVHLHSGNFCNDNNTSNGTVALSKALTVSSDTYFYTAGDMFWSDWKNGDAVTGNGLQTQAHDLGFGAKTGIEIDEAPGRIPDPAWKAAFAKVLYKDPVKRQENQDWLPGDDISLAVGQKDVLVTPLQLADAYSTFANGGTEWTPHLAAIVKDPITGKVVKTVAPKSHGTLSFDPLVHDQMLQGFMGAVQQSNGTAYQAFQNFPFSTIPGGVAGKTGTAQVTDLQGNSLAPTSVFVSFFPAAAPQYVVMSLVEQGGHGAAVAAPIVRQVIENILHLPETPFITNGGKD
jgi:penicillin-binding protein 2